MVEQRTVTVGRRTQLFEERREQRDVIGVDLRQLLERGPHAAVMRERMVRIGHVDLRVGAAAQLVPAHEGDDACAISLIRQELEVVHQLCMLGEPGWGTQGPFHQRHFLCALRFGDFDAPLDVTDRVEIRADFEAVARSELALEPRHVV